MNSRLSNPAQPIQRTAYCGKGKLDASRRELGLEAHAYVDGAVDAADRAVGADRVSQALLKGVNRNALMKALMNRGDVPK